MTAPFQTIFAAADAKASAAVSRVLGEPVELHPWKPTRGYTTAGGADPGRAVATFTATIGGAMGSQKIAGDRPGNDIYGPGVTSRESVISADLRDWPAYARIGDRIRQVSQAGQPWFEIAAMNTDKLNRAYAKLVRL